MMLSFVVFAFLIAAPSFTPAFVAGSCVNRLANNCPGYKQQGFCKSSSIYYKYMTTHCQKTCGFCGTGNTVTTSAPPVTSGQGNSKREFECSFDQSMCQWSNEHLDDTSDWVVGVQRTGGPRPAQGSGYLYLDSAGGGKAMAYLPWILVLPDGVENKGKMCMRFKYSIGSGPGSYSGILRVSTKPTPTTFHVDKTETRLFSRGSATNGWKDAKVTITVSTSSTLILEGSQGKTGGHVAIDNLHFTSGYC